MGKKRKLNSKNPKYNKEIKQDVIYKTKILVREIKGCKVYKCWE